MKEMSLQDVQSFSFEILKDVHVFCVNNNINYSLAYGTLIGAVRHHGIIPWDDDIDVFMPREDYELLQHLPDDIFGQGFRLASWKKTKNYTYDFLKLESLDTTILERFHPNYI